ETRLVKRQVGYHGIIYRPIGPTETKLFRSPKGGLHMPDFPDLKWRRKPRDFQPGALEKFQEFQRLNPEVDWEKDPTLTFVQIFERLEAEKSFIGVLG